MKAIFCMFALAGLASPGAQAQVLAASDARPQLERGQVRKPDPFAGSHQPYPRVYGANVAERPNDKALGIVRDPRLVGGAGATFKLDKRTTFEAEAARHGNVLKKLPLSPDGVKARMNMGF